MDRQPRLESERVLLRPLASDDWDALFEIASDAAIWEQHPMHDRWRSDVFREFFQDALAKGGALAIIDKRDGAIIGSSRFQEYEPDEDGNDGGSVEIGWTFIARKFWGKGINREVKRLMLAHAFEHVARVDFRVGETNYRSRIALENIGAERSRRTELSQYQGKRVLHIVYELTRDDFAKGLGAEGLGAES
jgi:RimJ/RimL family protein N-acetyltransferase